MEIYEKVISLCSENKVDKTALEQACGFSQNSLNKWRKSFPSADKVVKVAQFFNVSTDYLLGLTDERRPLSSASEAAQPSKAVAKRATTEITERFVGEFGELISDPTFCDLAKLYKAVNEVRLRAQILTVVVAYLNRNGIRTESIVGY